MKTYFSEARVELGQALFLRLEQAEGTTITCVEGCLWVTRDGFSTDIQLNPGQRYQVEEEAKFVMVSGFEPSLARILQPARSSRPAAPMLVSLLQRWIRRLA